MPIYIKIQETLKSFVSDRRGAVAVIFGVAIIPVVGLVGAAMDYSRAGNVKIQLQDAVDAAVLTAANERDLTDIELENLMRAQIELMINGAHSAHHLTIEFERNGDVETLLEAHARMSVETSILSIMRIDAISVSASAAVTVDYPNMEIALVLDNTGSMASRDRIGSLREAALDFVEKVSEDGTAENLAISVVPYVAQVNIGNTSTMEAYIDKEGLSHHHGEFLEGRVIARRDDSSCDEQSYVAQAPAERTQDSAVQTASTTRVPGFARLSVFQTYGDIITQLVGVQSANASSSLAHPHTIDGCFLLNPPQVNHWELFQQLEEIEWKGCVEARPEPFDVTDTPPDPNNPDTLWVPSFWLDGPSWYVDNNWIGDSSGLPSDYDFYDDGAVFSVYKYADDDGHSNDEIPNNTFGPNKSCGDPILPLTSDFDLITDHIDNMVHWNNGGTVTAQGVVWGWRALSPGEPFTEGSAYGEAKKVMVIMTDGVNQVYANRRHEHGPMGTDYSAYGHLYSGRLPSQSIGAAISYVDGRTLEACNNAKETGVIVYTVTFGLNSSAQQLWDNCATNTDMAYHVNSASQLVGAFNDIAESVGDLRLTR